MWELIYTKMTHIENNDSVILLSQHEADERLQMLRRAMAEHPQHPDALLVSDNANVYALTGRVFDGSVYVAADPAIPHICFVRRPVGLKGDDVVYIKRPEEIVASLGLNLPQTLGLELDVTAWSAIERYKRAFPEGTEIVNASPILRQFRSVKTSFEVDMMRRSGEIHASVYKKIPSLFTEGMTDIELQIEIERLCRQEGCLGQFRISGTTMEFFMGSVLVGDNSDNPSPYDFAMGGAGMDPSLPGGANGTTIQPGNSVMVDMNGNFNSYMTDMTRVFAFGEVAEKAQQAHQLSIDIHRRLQEIGLPGTPAKQLYEEAMTMVRNAGFEDYFMGHRQKAGFIGHGVCIEVNELPVIAPRSKDILQLNNTIALEPKFVIPGTGAVGIENTYVVTDHGLENLTPGCPEDIIQLLP